MGDDHLRAEQAETRTETPAEPIAPSAPPSDGPPGIVPGRHKWLVLSTVSVGTFMATLDSSIVNISLPTIQ